MTEITDEEVVRTPRFIKTNNASLPSFTSKVFLKFAVGLESVGSPEWAASYAFRYVAISVKISTTVQIHQLLPTLTRVLGDGLTDIGLATASLADVLVRLIVWVTK